MCTEYMRIDLAMSVGIFQPVNSNTNFNGVLCRRYAIGSYSKLVLLCFL
jgi:hypothetical protein